MNKKFYKVTIIQKSLPQYRKPFFNALKEELNKLGIELQLIYGLSNNSEAKKKDTIDLEWANKIENKIIKIGSKELYWQPCLSLLRDSDLIIVEQASKLLVNYILFLQNLLGIKKLCFWGHGKNLDRDNANTIAEKLKSILSNKVHWWFAYNELSKDIVAQLGFCKDKITVVQNAIDTEGLKEAAKKITDKQFIELKEEMGIKGKDICIYTGAMYKQKGLDFLLEAVQEIRKRNSEFEMIFIGAGPDEYKIKQAAQNHSWIHYVGAKFDSEKVPYLKISKLLLLPSAVGLVVLDSFALGVPLVTTSANNHGPEIDYIESGKNGLIVNSSDVKKAYVENVVLLLENEQMRKRYANKCIEDSEKYTIEKMVKNYSSGLKEALMK
ncbi:group 1 glycosyl transferase [Priestia megaterium]|uniref:glycosyltransferase family 4 protein n=1 Tax=Priestia megaterium TaxID=1404 RepID=UPI000BF88A26|nr:glycosyltransferase family 4 protein [Priestia megaterium]PFL70511.1 group 1 glycosyl transferase [Priestia megaterium]